jgi:putative transposase
VQHGRPEIINSDQGSQFTSDDYTNLIKENNVKISMDGRCRALDNIMIERFWRTLKYTEVYIKDYETPKEARREIGRFIQKYNCIRLHSSLGYRTPAEVYHGTAAAVAV